MDLTPSAPLIAGVYRIIEQIGSGGGGIVYLAEHTRLNKKVVLKADKRPLTTKPEVLRREADSLKNLSHTYIPQVYDFISEDGRIFTVMDYIEGESLDKPLKRGERFSQALVIRWAVELLQALSYLHSRPPHGILHGDIKPANVILTPQGDVCLIDFNIALALGEDGAIAIGYSAGYASPEHFKAVFYASGESQETTTDLIETEPRLVTETDMSLKNNSRLFSDEIGTINKRSDIYSLGATLYHLLTGVYPHEDAAKVKPISEMGVSPAVADIITKAMNPDKTKRWQSADEMLYAFTHLRENDPRVIRYKK